MKSWRAPEIFRPFSRNVIVYDGPSQLTGDPILVIASAQNGNRKIGKMVQLWIMLRDISPIEAVKTGLDAAVCGDCPFRGDGTHRVCYVEYWRAVQNIWSARQRAIPMPSSVFASRVKLQQIPLRVAAYGDPGAVPMHVWEPLLDVTPAWTSYTHQWRWLPDVYKGFCMASVDSVEEQALAASRGWRTYRVRAEDEPMLATEVVCPASDDGGKRVKCSDCALCRGTSRAAKHVVIAAHGDGALHFVPVQALRHA